jgi:hypothetical protein
MAGRVPASALASDQKLIENSMMCAMDSHSYVLSIADIRSPNSNTIRKFYTQYLADLSIFPQQIADV